MYWAIEILEEPNKPLKLPFFAPMLSDLTLLTQYNMEKYNAIVKNKLQCNLTYYIIHYISYLLFNIT